MPTYGHTKSGRPIHARTRDHLPSDTVYARFNKRLAIIITDGVGTMWCAYGFALIALTSLPVILVQAGVVPTSWVPGFLQKPGLILIVAWIAQTFLQLVLLSIILVGQSVQSLASDARAAKTFEDVEAVLDRLDIKTEGGIRDLRDELLAEIRRPVMDHAREGS